MSEEDKSAIVPFPTIKYTPEQVDLIKRMFAVGATNDELALFIYTSKMLGLNILTKQIHMIKRKRKNPATGVWEEVAAIQVGIDGYVQLAQQARGPKGEVLLDGFSSKATVNDKGEVTGAKAVIYRKDFNHPVEVEIDFDEYCFKLDGKPAALWATKPKVLIEKCALALALRRTFPQVFSGTYVPEETEASEAIPIIEVKPVKVELIEAPAKVEESVVAPGTQPTPTEVAKVTGKPILRILKEIPVLFNGKGNIGPFKPEDVIYEDQIPLDTIKGWIDRGLAKEIVPKGDERKIPTPSKEEKVNWEPLQVEGVDVGGIRRTADGCQIWFDRRLPIPKDPRQDTMQTFMVGGGTQKIGLKQTQEKEKAEGRDFTWEFDKEYNPDEDVEFYLAINIKGAVPQDRWNKLKNSAQWTVKTLLEKAQAQPT